MNDPPNLFKKEPEHYREVNERSPTSRAMQVLNPESRKFSAFKKNRPKLL